MSLEVMEEMFHDTRFVSIDSSSPDIIATSRSSFSFALFYSMKSVMFGKFIEFVNSILTFLFYEIVPRRTSGGFGPESSKVQVTASLACFFY